MVHVRRSLPKEKTANTFATTPKKGHIEPVKKGRCHASIERARSDALSLALQQI